jgi:hypothetical protein
MKKFMIILFVVVLFFQLVSLYATELLEPPLDISQDSQRPTILVKCFPETCQVGDTIYLIVEARNSQQENIKISHFVSIALGTIRINFIDPEKNVIPFLFDVNRRVILNPKPQLLLLQPNESQIIWRRSITVPPLEDLYGQKYWRDLLKNFPEQGQSFQIRTTVTILNDDKEYTSQCSIKLKSRIKKELDIFEGWYKNTPEYLFPYVDAERVDRSPIPLKLKISKTYCKELVDKVSYLQCHILSLQRLGNRYPGYPNLPSDWQGWQKLEESFGASTLRDEIRWTRVCLQYCTTGDEKVLDELKLWLEKMNPIQRTVMVNNYFHKNENLPNSKKLYETIQSFKNKK